MQPMREGDNSDTKKRQLTRRIPELFLILSTNPPP